MNWAVPEALLAYIQNYKAINLFECVQSHSTCKGDILMFKCP